VRRQIVDRLILCGALNGLGGERRALLCELDQFLAQRPPDPDAARLALDVAAPSAETYPPKARLFPQRILPSELGVPLVEPSLCVLVLEFKVGVISHAGADWPSMPPARLALPQPASARATIRESRRRPVPGRTRTSWTPAGNWRPTSVEDTRTRLTSNVSPAPGRRTHSAELQTFCKPTRLQSLGSNEIEWDDNLAYRHENRSRLC